jgi:hypothetical protein
MLKLDISQIQRSGDTFFNSTDTAYLIFLLIGILGYFSVPTVANFIVHAHGQNGMLQRTNSVAATTATTTIAAASALGNRMEQGRSNILNAPGDFMKGYNSAGSGSANSNHQKDRLSGKA